MSGKPKRDITLGEMQDECRKFEWPLCGGNKCAYWDLCKQMKTGCTPHAWDLTDPPRFSDEAMAFLNGLYMVGIRVIQVGGSVVQAFRKDGTTDARFAASLIGTKASGEIYENIDLAELLGKDDHE